MRHPRSISLVSQATHHDHFSPTSYIPLAIVCYTDAAMSQELTRYRKKLQTFIDTYIRHLGELEALERSSAQNTKRKMKAKQSRLLEEKQQIVELLAITPPLMHDVIEVYPFLSDELFPGIGVNHAPKTLKDVEARDYARDDDYV